MDSEENEETTLPDAPTVTTAQDAALIESRGRVGESPLPGLARSCLTGNLASLPQLPVGTVNSVSEAFKPRVCLPVLLPHAVNFVI